MTYNAQSSILEARMDVGYHEGPDNYNKFSIWQGLAPNNPWCASAVCKWAVDGGGYQFPANSTFGVKGEAYVPTMRERAMQEGLWRDKSWHAQPGDFWLYDWQHDGLLDHVEMVVVDDGTRAVLIGGNTSDQCMFRTRNRDNLAGIYALSQSTQAEPPWKVQPMWTPAEQFVAGLGNPEGGAWMLRDNGTVVFVSAAGPDHNVEGGMTTPADRAAWGHRHGAKLEPRTKRNGRPGYRIRATSNEVYVPAAQS